MKLIFIFGLPATGKLTVAQELASMTGYKLFHNHLAVDLLLSVFDFGSAGFVRLREEIWLRVFEEASMAKLSGLIFTFAPEATVRQEFLADTVALVTRLGGNIDFIELTCPMEELKRRMDSETRKQFQKLTSVSLFEQLDAAGRFEAPVMPMPRLSIDTSVFTPSEVAEQIVERLGLGGAKE